MLPKRNLVAIGAVGAILRSFSFGGSVGLHGSQESLNLINLIEREKAVYSTTDKTAITRPIDHTGEM